MGSLVILLRRRCAIFEGILLEVGISYGETSDGGNCVVSILSPSEGEGKLHEDGGFEETWTNGFWSDPQVSKSTIWMGKGGGKFAVSRWQESHHVLVPGCLHFGNFEGLPLKNKGLVIWVRENGSSYRKMLEE